MRLVSPPPVEPADLLDLKLLPAWVKEPAETRKYERYTGEDESWERRGRGDPRGKRSTSNAQRPKPNRRRAEPRTFKKTGGDSERFREQRRSGRSGQDRGKTRHREARSKIPRPVVPEITIRFL